MKIVCIYMYIFPVYRMSVGVISYLYMIVYVSGTCI